MALAFAQRRMNHSTTANGTETGLEISTQAVEAEIRDRADPRQVLADRVAQLYRQMPIAIGATFIAGAIATFELQRSEEHTSELQSQSNLVCRLLLEKK